MDRWTEAGQCLEKFGVKNPLKFLKNEIKEAKSPKRDLQPVPLNKVGEYCEAEDGNTTLPVEFNRVKTKAILDSGAGIAIATKTMWEKWEKPIDENEANGYVEKPMGLLERLC